MGENGDNVPNFRCRLLSKAANARKRQLEQLYGAENVVAPEMKSMKIVLATITSLVCLSFGVIAAVIILFWHIPLLWAILTTIAAVLCGIVFNVLAFRGVLSIILAHGVRISTRSYDTHRPNIISELTTCSNGFSVADGFGCVVARRIPRPKPPVIFFCPALEKYARWSGDKSHRRLDLYPYLLIIHDTKKSSIKVNDSFKTLERADPGRSRLEVLEASRNAMELSDIEVRAYIDETYTNGKAGVTEIGDGEVIDLETFSPIGPK